MKVEIEPGKYVVAVSGGVDSVVLLDVLAQQKDLELIVSHYDHGMRKTSADDQEFVRELARKYHCEYVYETGNLRADTSEARARERRYVFLQRVQKQHRARGIITAHHQDDVLETMIMNLLRGTDRKGLSSLISSHNLLRPLLHYSKQAIRDYAQVHKLQWREDETNTDERYFRNYVRLQIAPKLSDDNRQQFLAIYTKMSRVNQEFDQEIALLLQSQESQTVDRNWFLQFPVAIARELVAELLRHERAEVNREAVDKIFIALRTLQPGKELQVNKQTTLKSLAGRCRFVRNSV